MEDFHDTLANGNPFFKNNATFVVSFAQQALEALYEINIKHKSLHNRVLEKNFVFKKEDGVFTFKLTNFAMMTKIDQERTKDSKGDILALSVIMKALMSKTSFENSSFQAMAEPDPKHRSNAAELLKEAFGIDHSTENPPEPTASTSGAHTAGAAGGGRGKQSRTKAPTSSRNMGQRSAHKGKQEGNLGPNDHLNRSDGEKKSGRNRRSEPQGFPTLALIPKPKMSEDTKSKHGTSTHESSRNKTKLVIRNPATELVPNHRQPYEDNENSEGSEGSEDSENSDSGSDHLEPRPVSRAPPPTLPPSKPEQNAPPPAPQKMNKWNPADYQVNNVASSSNGSYNLPSSAPGQGPPKLVVSYSPHLKAFQGQMGTGYSPDVQFPQNPRRK